MTNELKKELCNLIRAGTPYEHATRAVGISTTTFHRWLKDGEKAKSGKYRVFWEAIKKAEGKRVAEALNNIRLAGKKSWQADAWFLERRYPEQFAKIDDKLKAEEIRLEREKRRKNEMSDEELLVYLKGVVDKLEKKVSKKTKKGKNDQISKGA
ncbi:MAG: hypothetical protein KDD43_00010 [Bdellovibrionales bacterium]|nr:hypothetical protein [Bdellovibrionales bacterium]